MAARVTRPSKPSYHGGHACSVLLVPVLTILLSDVIRNGSMMIVNILGNTRYSSTLDEPGANVFLLMVVILLSVVTVTLVFPPSRWHAWFASERATAGALPRYGLITYCWSLALSGLAGFLVALLMLNALVKALGENVAFAWSWSNVPYDYLHLLFPSGILFALLAFGLLTTPPRVNWLVRWYYQDFWESRR